MKGMKAEIQYELNIGAGLWLIVYPAESDGWWVFNLAGKKAIIRSNAYKLNVDKIQTRNKTEL